MQASSFFTFGFLLFVAALMFFQFQSPRTNKEFRDGLTLLFGSLSLLLGATSVHDSIMLEGTNAISYIVGFLALLVLLISAKTIVQSANKT